MPDTIEAEVLEIDGSPPPAPREPEPPRRERRAWSASLGGKVLRLDRRWWPLWVLLGIVALALALTVGLVIAAGLMVLKVIGGIVRFFLGGGSSPGGSSLSRRG